MKKNCRITSFFVFGSYVKIIIIIFFVIVVVHGNLAWDFTMLVGDIKHQQNQNQINSQCSNFGPNCMDLYYSNLREHWQSFYSFLTQDLLPKWAPAELPPEASLVTSQRKSWFPQNCASCLWPWQRGFPPPPRYTQRKIFSCGRKNEPHPNFWHLQKGNWLSVTPVVCVSYFLSSLVCNFDISIYFLWHTVGWE